MLHNTKFGKYFAETESDLQNFILSETKKELLTKLYQLCNSKISVLGEGYPEMEAQTWPVQLEEAKAYLADNAAPTPFILTAISEDETVEEYASLIVANNDEWSGFAGSVVKMRRTFESKISSADTVERIKEIEQELYNA